MSSSESNMEDKLLQLVTIPEENNKDADQTLALNDKSHHKQMINDVQWAPVAGRSFHLVASCSKDCVVIVWRLVLKDIMKGEILEVPQIQAVQKIEGSNEIQRIKWNILGTCFATSSQNGEVMVWQRNLITALSSLNPAEISDYFTQMIEEETDEFFRQMLHFKSK